MERSQFASALDFLPSALLPSASCFLAPAPALLLTASSHSLRARACNPATAPARGGAKRALGDWDDRWEQANVHPNRKLFPPLP